MPTEVFALAFEDQGTLLLQCNHDAFVYGLWPGFLDRFMGNMELTEFQHGILAYRITMEQVRDECAAEIIGRWEGKLSVVDLWADSHCETVVMHAIMH